MKTTIKTTQLLEYKGSLPKSNFNDTLVRDCHSQPHRLSEIPHSTWEKLENSIAIVVKFADGYYVLKCRVNQENIATMNFTQVRTFKDMPVCNVGYTYMITYMESTLFRDYCKRISSEVKVG